MEQPTSPVNPWLLSYIVQYQHSRSRYEIDRTLLLSGYPAAEIEAAWEMVLSGQSQKLTRTPDEIKRQQFTPNLGCIKYVVFASLLFLILLAIVVFIYFQPALPEPLPDYPASTRFNIKTTLPKSFLESYCDSMEVFEGNKYQLFTSTDNKQQILSFYKGTALERGFDFVGIDTNFVRNRYTLGLVCFSHGVTNPKFSPSIPTVAVRVFSWDNADDARIMAQYFPQAPPKMNVILLLQGFKFRSVD